MIRIRSHARIVVLSAAAIFAELALIRFLGSEVRIFAYFKNLILIACFLGFGLGFLRSAFPPRLAASVLTMSLATAAIALAARFELRWGPQIAVQAWSNFADSLTMGEQFVAAGDTARVIGVGMAWTLALFLVSIGSMYGFAQQIGRDIEAFGASRRLLAYGLNVAGSLLGVLAFAGLSRFALGPAYWFAPVALLAALYTRHFERFACLASTVLVAFALIQPEHVVWSPYQKLEWQPQTHLLVVNGTAYLVMRDMDQPSSQLERTGLDRFRLPHTIVPGAKRVLIIGAGAGNDIAAALRAGAQRVVAVEIDREILALGRRYHPNKPFDDPRVEVVLDDARHYGETSTEQFDLIVFSHLDSHTALSGFTNVRLDNYIYTVESLRTFAQRLAPDGALYLSFYATRDWVATRLETNLRLAFGQAPVTLNVRGELRLRTDLVATGESSADAVIERPVTKACFVATRSASVRAHAEQVRGKLFERNLGAASVEPSTDDWPYLFVRERAIPGAMLLLALVLGVVSALVIAILAREQLARERRLPLDRHFFFLGAAFLLIEVHNVSKLARVFGTTWSVNAWVISGVLLTILAATAAAARYPRVAASRLMYVPLLGLLLANAGIPIDALLHLPFAQLLVTVLYTAPLFFAGLIFASSLRATRQPMTALGSNVLGSLLGGLLELASFVIGLTGLMFLAAAMYALSFPKRVRDAEPSGVSAAATAEVDATGSG